MKAVLCKAFGGPDDLVLEDIPAPKLGKADVRIAVHAAGVNFPDVLMITGKYQVKPEFPFSPGIELAGEVLETGSGVSGVSSGQRVMATLGYGGFAEEAVVPAQSVYAIPDDMDYRTAAGFPITYGTAHHALIDRTKLQAGEVFLVLGAAGGVGLAAVEVGALLGAKVIGAVGADAKASVVREHGAEAVINYSSESIRDRVKDLTGGHGADVVFDPVGGEATTESVRSLAWRGRLLVIGFASGHIPEIAANRLLLKEAQAVGVYWGAFATREPAQNRANIEDLLRWYGEGRIKPLVSATFPLSGAGEALTALIERKVTGKAVLNVRT